MADSAANDPVRALELALRDGLPGSDPDAAFSELVDTLNTHPDAWIRESAAYGLAFSFQPRAAEPLLSALANLGEVPAVRGQAAEGLGLILEGTDRRRRAFKLATVALMDALNDRAAEVRFWACYALGQMRAAAALPALRRVGEHDDVLYVRGAPWWLVKDEAADAIAWILGETPPPRDRIDPAVVEH